MTIISKPILFSLPCHQILTLCRAQTQKSRCVRDVKPVSIWDAQNNCSRCPLIATQSMILSHCCYGDRASFFSICFNICFKLMKILSFHFAMILCFNKSWFHIINAKKNNFGNIKLQAIKCSLLTETVMLGCGLQPAELNPIWWYKTEMKRVHP